MAHLKRLSPFQGTLYSLQELLDLVLDCWPSLLQNPWRILARDMSYVWPSLREIEVAAARPTPRDKTDGAIACRHIPH